MRPSISRLAGASLLMFVAASPREALAVPPLPLVPPECPVSPFGDASLVQYQAGVIGECRGNATRWRVDAPKARAADVGPSLMRAEFSSLSTWHMPSVRGTMRLDWSGMRGEDAASNQRTMFSLGGLVKLHRTLALQTRVGVEQTDVQRNRAVVSSVWRPSPLAVLFAEWAGSEFGTESHRVGGRLWLVPRRLSFDIRLRHVPETTGWVEQRFGLSLSLPL